MEVWKTGPRRGRAAQKTRVTCPKFWIEDFHSTPHTSLRATPLKPQYTAHDKRSFRFDRIVLVFIIYIHGMYERKKNRGRLLVPTELL